MHAEDFKKRAWAEVDLDVLQHNFKEMKKMVKPETRLLVAVKANAYGHGAVMCAKALLEAGADYLAVATIEEALELRQAQIDAPILILGYVAKEDADKLVTHDITATVYCVDFAKTLSETAVALNKKAKIHIKLNTGMERLGFSVNEIEAIKSISSLPGLEMEGLFTHLACADAEDSSSVHLQYERFMQVADSLKAAGISIRLRHVLNSAGIFDFPQYQLDMVRPGIALYGYYPSTFIHTERASLRPVLSFKSRVSFLHEADCGAGISYGWTYKAQTPVRVATVPVGYADGYNRLLSNKAFMLAGDKRVPVIGRICMDQCMIDVTSVHTINVGDEITIIGGGEAGITADELAKLSNTISYEILCAVGKRIPRLYLQSGEFVGVLNGFA